MSGLECWLGIHRPSPNPRLITQENNGAGLFQMEMTTLPLKGENSGTIGLIKQYQASIFKHKKIQMGSEARDRIPKDICPTSLQAH